MEVDRLRSARRVLLEALRQARLVPGMLRDTPMQGPAHVAVMAFDRKVEELTRAIDRYMATPVPAAVEDGLDAAHVSRRPSK